MRRWRSALLVGVLLFSLLPTPAIAAVKAGAACAKQNQVQKVQGKQYKCLKNGGKLKWALIETKPLPSTPEVKPIESPVSDIIEIRVGDVCSNGYKGYVKTTSTKTLRCKVANDGTLRWLDDSGQTPDPTLAVAAPSPDPTPQKKSVLLPSNFEDLFDNAEGSATAAWNSAAEKIKGSSAPSIRQDLFVGPNTKMLNSRVSDAYERATKLFVGFSQPQSFTAIYYEYQDVNWAKAKVSEIGLPFRVSGEIEGSCGSAARCNGASGGKSTANSGFIQLSVGETDRYHLQGGLEMHEYAHIAQAMQFVGKKTDDFSFRYLPTWLLEGHAHVIGLLGSANSLDEYKQNRATWLNDYPKRGTQSFTANDVEVFYDSLMPGREDQNMRNYVYSLGYITIEYLVALKGVDSPMQMILDIANGSTFEDAFKKNYGVDWSTAKPLLANAIYKEFNKG